MEIHINFFSDQLLNPQIIVKSKGRSESIRNARWIQFIAYLVHQLYDTNEEGWVSVGDIKRLNAFAKVKTKQIGKYLYNSSITRSDLFREFLRFHLLITVKGPYKIHISPDKIFVDRTRLRKYVNSILRYYFTANTDTEVLWDMGLTSYSNYEFSTSRRLFEAFYNLSVESGTYPAERLCLALIKLVEIDRFTDNIAGVKLNSNRILRLSKEVDDPRKGDIFKAITLSLNALCCPVEDHTVQNAIELSLESTQLAKSGYGSDPDRYCVLAGNQYHRYYLALRYGTMEMSEKAITNSIKLYKDMNQAGIPQYIAPEKGIIEGIQLQVNLIKSTNSGKIVADDDLAMYRYIVENEVSSKLITLHLAEWISHSYFQNNMIDEAKEVINSALLVHPELHETAIFSRMQQQHLEYGFR